MKEIKYNEEHQKLVETILNDPAFREAGQKLAPEFKNVRIEQLMATFGLAGMADNKALCATMIVVLDELGYCREQIMLISTAYAGADIELIRLANLFVTQVVRKIKANENDSE